MCGIVGTKDGFFSKTKRFCSVSCSRSYSSNSKKASILARLQVSNTLLNRAQNPRKRRLLVYSRSKINMAAIPDIGPLGLIA